VGAALFGEPNLGPLYSVFPFGLSAVAPLEAAAPTLIVVVAASVLTIVAFSTASRNQRLA
jgi:hypothetical protein